MGQAYFLLDDGTVRIDDTVLHPRTWVRAPFETAQTGRALDVREVFTVLGQAAPLRHLVVGVIGPRDATAQQEKTAEAVGRVLGERGLTVICGGKSGVMEAVCRGCSAVGGLAIGILPGTTPDDANPFVGIPLPTGLSEGRNMVIARAARVLVAVGGSYGTLSEVAYGLHFSKRVIGLEGAPQVDGVIHARSIDAALDLTLEALIASAQPVDRVVDV